jgi:hypothetical protein
MLLPQAARVLVMCALVSSTAGCALTRWTDRSFLGTTGGDPRHRRRVLTGIVLVPFAIVGDVVTAPLQVIVLIIGGDDALSPKEGPRRDLGSLDERARTDLRAVHVAMTARCSPPALYGVDHAGNVLSLAVSQDRVDRALAWVDRDGE